MLFLLSSNRHCPPNRSGTRSPPPAQGQMNGRHGPRDKKLMVNKAEAETVRIIFELQKPASSSWLIVRRTSLSRGRRATSTRHLIPIGAGAAQFPRHPTDGVGFRRVGGQNLDVPQAAAGTRHHFKSGRRLNPTGDWPARRPSLPSPPAGRRRACPAERATNSGVSLLVRPLFRLGGCAKRGRRVDQPQIPSRRPLPLNQGDS